MDHVRRIPSLLPDAIEPVYVLAKDADGSIFDASANCAPRF
jgi:hypothetical protein